MPTLRQLAQAIAVDLGYVGDDSLRNEFAIMLNVAAAISKLNDEQITEAMKRGDEMSVANMAEDFVVTLTNHTPADSNDWPYQFFQLPTQIYTLPKDGGVAYIRYNRPDLPPNCPPTIASAVFGGTTLGALSGLYQSRMQKPAPNRPYWCRGRHNDSGVMKDYVYVYGVNPQITKLLVGLYTSLPMDMVGLANAADQEVDLSPEKLRALKRMVLDDEAWMLNIPQQRRKNDGRDLEPNQTVRTPRQTSVNDPTNVITPE